MTGPDAEPSKREIPTQAIDPDLTAARSQAGVESTLDGRDRLSVFYGHHNRSWPAVPRAASSRPGRPRRRVCCARYRAQSRGRAQADPRSPRRRSNQPGPVSARGRDHRRPRTPRDRPGLRDGRVRKRTSLLRNAIYSGRLASKRRSDVSDARSGASAGAEPATQELDRAAAVRPNDSKGSRDLELRKLLRRFLDVCNAIDYAHSRGVLHRDIKPANIILGKHGETLVVDWGLAKATGKGDASAARANDDAQLVKRQRRDTARLSDGHARVHEPRAGPRRDRPARASV